MRHCSSMCGFLSHLLHSHCAAQMCQCCCDVIRVQAAEQACSRHPRNTQLVGHSAGAASHPNDASVVLQAVPSG
jgi:hypothetical protein